MKSIWWILAALVGIALLVIQLTGSPDVPHDPLVGSEPLRAANVDDAPLPAVPIEGAAAPAEARTKAAGEELPEEIAPEVGPALPGLPSLDEHERPAPPTGILVVELVGVPGPFDDGVLHLQVFDYQPLPPDPWAADVDMQHQQLDANGVARFRDLEPGYVSVGVEWPRGSFYTAHTTVRIPEETGAHQIIRLGAGRIHGTVYGQDGQPAASVEVNAWNQAAESSRVTRTADDGTYELTSLPPGSWSMSAVAPAIDGQPSPVRLHQVAELAKGQSAQVDFGSAGPSCTWRAHVVDRAGDPVPNRGPRETSPGFLQLYDLDFGVSRTFPYDDGGAFEIQVPTGRYTVKLHGPSKQHGDLLEIHTKDDPVVLGPEGSTQDVVLPGITLRGTVVGTDGEVLAGAPQDVSVSILNEDQTYLVAHSRMDDDGTYVLAGLDPGTYIVNTWRPEPVEEHRVTLRESDTSVIVDVTVK